MELEQHAEIMRELELFRAKLFGNGSPGVLSDIRDLKGRMDRVDEMTRMTDARLAKIERLIYVAMGAFGGLQLLLK